MLDPIPLTGGPSLHGVDHTARPTSELREHFHFYRDILGLSSFTR